MIQKIPYLLTLFGIVLGVFIAILFGVNESIFKEQINRDLQKNEKVISFNGQGDALQKYLENESEKNWRYYQRFHFHSTGISAMSLGLLILLSFSSAPFLYRIISSYMVSFGGFLYPFVWLFAAYYGPSMGRDIAKEKFAIFGYMGGVFLVGVIVTIFLVARYPHGLIRKEKTNE